MLKLKLQLQYFGHLKWRSDPLEKTLVLGKIESKRRREWQKMRRLDSITNSMDMSLSKLQEIVKGQGRLACCSPWICKELDMTAQQQKVCHSFSSNEQASFNFMAVVTIYCDFGTQENEVSHCFHCFPIYLPGSDGTGCRDLHFSNVEF